MISELDCKFGWNLSEPQEGFEHVCFNIFSILLLLFLNEKKTLQTYISQQIVSYGLIYATSICYL